MLDSLLIPLSLTCGMRHQLPCPPSVCVCVCVCVCSSCVVAPFAALVSEAGSEDDHAGRHRGSNHPDAAGGGMAEEQYSKSPNGARPGVVAADGASAAHPGGQGSN